MRLIEIEVEKAYLGWKNWKDWYLWKQNGLEKKKGRARQEKNFKKQFHGINLTLEVAPFEYE